MEQLCLSLLYPFVGGFLVYGIVELRKPCGLSQQGNVIKLWAALVALVAAGVWSRVYGLWEGGVTGWSVGALFLMAGLAYAVAVAVNDGLKDQDESPTATD